MKVCKFGGTSMANAQTIERVANIILSDDDRCFVVVSAPGKRDNGDTKVTDMLYDCFEQLNATGNIDDIFSKIQTRFCDIVSGLGIDMDIDAILASVKKGIIEEHSKDYTASRGEYLSAQVLAKKLGAEFVDTAGLIVFDADGNLSMDESISRLQARLAGVKKAVLPGFYGSDSNDKIRTFSRGGSDVSGAIVARAVNADVYENWTDVDGFLSADPHIVDNPILIDHLSYRELRELSYMGADVLHPESIFPVRSAGIPINIRNTFNPDFKGTMILPPNKLPETSDKVVTGIAGRKGFTIINIEKEMMNSEIGFGRKVLAVLEEENISFEHVPSGIDTLSVVIRDELINGKMQEVLGKLQNSINGDSIEILSGLSLIATVGHNMASRRGTAATLFTALANNRINIHMIDQGSSELNIIVGVASSDYEKAINAIYHAFIQ